MSPSARAALAPLLLAAALLSGCFTHQADLSADLSQFVIAGDVPALNHSPAGEPRPLRLGLVRVQHAGSRSGGADIADPDAADADWYRSLRDLPGVERLGVFSTEFIPAGDRATGPEPAEALLAKARRAGFDGLIVYTFESRTRSTDWFAPLSMATLGVAPTHMARTRITARAVVIDLAGRRCFETDGSTSVAQPANFWTVEEAGADARLTAHDAAMRRIAAAMTEHWPRIRAGLASAPTPDPHHPAAQAPMFPAHPSRPAPVGTPYTTSAPN